MTTAPAPDEQARPVRELVLAPPPPSSTSLLTHWSDRLRHAAIILIAAALALTALVLFAQLAIGPAIAAFACLVAAALVPWRLHDGSNALDDALGVSPVEMPVVRAIVGGMPDPAVLLDRAGRVIHLNAAAAQLAPALRVRELAQFALRSPEIVTALREAIATSSRAASPISTTVRSSAGSN